MSAIFSDRNVWINVHCEFGEIREKSYLGEVQVMCQNVSVSFGHGDQIKRRHVGYLCINVTMRRVRATIVAVEGQKVLHILSVCL